MNTLSISSRAPLPRPHSVPLSASRRCSRGSCAGIPPRRHAPQALDRPLPHEAQAQRRPDPLEDQDRSAHRHRGRPHPVCAGRQSTTKSGGSGERDGSGRGAVGDAVGEGLLELLDVVVEGLRELAGGARLDAAQRDRLQRLDDAQAQAAEHAVGGGVGEVLGGGGREGADHEGGGGPAGDRGDAAGGVVDEERDGDRVDRQLGGQGAGGGHDRQEAGGEEG